MSGVMVRGTIYGTMARVKMCGGMVGGTMG